MTKNSIDLTDCLFHGLSCEKSRKKQRLLEKQRLVDIIRSGAILSRYGVKEKFGSEKYNKKNVNFCALNYNEDHFISICTKKSRNEKSEMSEAFKIFCFERVALILDKNVLAEVDYRIHPKGEDGEIQVAGRIDKKFIKGVAVWADDEEEILKHKLLNGEKTEECLKFLEEYDDYIGASFVRQILGHYKLDIPIYSSKTGKVITKPSVLLEKYESNENC